MRFGKRHGASGHVHSLQIVQDPEPIGRKVAYVQCSGDCDHANLRAAYFGIADCASAVNAGLCF